MPSKPQPSRPTNYPIKDLTRGLVLNVNTSNIADGAWLESKNYFPDTTGIRRRRALFKFGSGSADYGPVQGLAGFWKTDGTFSTLLIDNKFIYDVVTTGFTGKYWVYDTGTVSVSGSTVTGSGTTWDFSTNSIKVGDVIVLDADGSGDGPEEGTISSIDSATQLTLSAAPTGTYGAGTDYEIRRAFNCPTGAVVDWTLRAGMVVFTDYNRYPTYYDGTTYTTYDSTIDFAARCVLFHRDRMFFANTIDSSGVYHRQRIKWSSPVTDPTDFSDGYYVDRPYKRSQILRLFSMGPNIAAYFEDGIDVGTPSTITGESAPYAWQSLDTGGRGLAGPRAITSWLDGHFFVAHDNIYFLNPNLNRDDIGTAVVRDTIRKCEDFSLVWAANDIPNDCIVFGFPDTASAIQKIWRYNYKTGSWGYDEMSASMLSNTAIIQNLTWDTLDTYISTDTWDDGMSAFENWDSIVGEDTEDQLYVGADDSLYYFNSSGSLDYGTTAITAELQTKDFDFGAPDLDKTVNRMSVRLYEDVTNDVSWTVSSSTDKGSTWREVGTLTIDAGETENFITFAATGPTIRFKLVSTSDIEEYTVTEIVLVVRGRGRQIYTV